MVLIGSQRLEVAIFDDITLSIVWTRCYVTHHRSRIFFDLVHTSLRRSSSRHWALDFALYNKTFYIFVLSLLNVTKIAENPQVHYLGKTHWFVLARIHSCFSPSTGFWELLLSWDFIVWYFVWELSSDIKSRRHPLFFCLEILLFGTLTRKEQQGTLVFL